MNRKDVHIECVEVSKHASEDLNQNGIKTFNGKIYEYNSRDKFDVVVATEVIEHDLNPKNFVKSIHNTLKEGGIFFGTTGNIDSLISKVKGQSWYYLDPPAHLSYFTPKSIKILFQESGFKEIHVMNLGFNWIKVLIRYNATFLMPFFGKLNIATGMIVIAKK